MSALAPTLEAFFTDRLINQRQASPKTVAAYRDTLRLLLSYAQERVGKPPVLLDFADLNADLIAAFLTHLEQDRHNSARTRNTRLAAIRSLFRFAALRHPEHAELIQHVLAIPTKHYDHAMVSFLSPAETNALLQAPDRSTWIGRRDHALMALTVQTGLRVSELTALTFADLHLETGPYVKCRGKGRKERITPLTKHTVDVLRVWAHEQQAAATDPLFPARTRNAALSPDAVQWLLAKHVDTAARDCPSLGTKKVSPHTLRHTFAMNLLRAGIDVSVIALWLGHVDVRSTLTYLHADMALKEKALALTTPPNTPPGRYRPPDALLAFLDSL